MTQKLVLAYSGVLDTSVMIRWIKKYGYDVITVTADVGQADEIWAMPTVVANARRREHPSNVMQYKVAAKATTQMRKAK